MKTIALTDGTLLKETIAKIQPTDNDLAIEITKKLIKMANLTNGQDLGIAPTLNFCVYASSRYTENEPIPGWILPFIEYWTIINDNVSGFPIEEICIKRGNSSNNSTNIINF